MRAPACAQPRRFLAAVVANGPTRVLQVTDLQVHVVPGYSPTAAAMSSTAGPTDSASGRMAGAYLGQGFGGGAEGHQVPSWILLTQQLTQQLAQQVRLAVGGSRSQRRATPVPPSRASLLPSWCGAQFACAACGVCCWQVGLHWTQHAQHGAQHAQHGGRQPPAAGGSAATFWRSPASARDAGAHAGLGLRARVPLPVVSAPRDRR